jgi:hypothetical protein
VWEGRALGGMAAAELGDDNGGLRGGRMGGDDNRWQGSTGRKGGCR